MKKSEWAERSETRAKEQEAIEAAIKILSKVTGVRTEAHRGSARGGVYWGRAVAWERPDLSHDCSSHHARAVDDCRPGLPWQSSPPFVPLAAEPPSRGSAVTRCSDTRPTLPERGPHKFWGIWAERNWLSSTPGRTWRIAGQLRCA